MANTKSSQKSVRKTEPRRLKNTARKTSIKTALKKVHIALSVGAPAAELQLLLSDVAAKLARAGSKGVIHKRAASRRLSRVALRVAGLLRLS